MREKYILLSGRTAAGKTEMILAYANQYPKTTLILTKEYTKESIRKDRKIDKNVMIVENLRDINISNYETICIDYAELFNMNELQNLIISLMKIDIRIILATHMKYGSLEVYHDYFSMYQKDM